MSQGHAAEENNLLISHFLEYELSLWQGKNDRQ